MIGVLEVPVQVRWTACAHDSLHCDCCVSFVHVAPLQTKCSPGRYSTANECLLCPAGKFSSPTSSTCTSCFVDTPYSRPGSGSAASCTDCASGCDGTFGLSLTVPPCANTDWTVWTDTAGVEGAHSCIRRFSDGVSWEAAKSNCYALGQDVHMLSTKQVWCHARGCVSHDLLAAWCLLVGSVGTGSHLALVCATVTRGSVMLSSLQTNFASPNSLLWAAYSLDPGSHSWIGAYRAADGWRYLGTTSASSALNCGSRGCGVWLGGQPDNSNYGSEDKAAIVAANGGRLADYTWSNNYQYTCQRTWTCGSACDPYRGVQVCALSTCSVHVQPAVSLGRYAVT
jgi:hypothetical protein